MVVLKLFDVIQPENLAKITVGDGKKGPFGYTYPIHYNVTETLDVQFPEMSNMFDVKIRTQVKGQDGEMKDIKPTCSINKYCQYQEEKETDYHWRIIQAYRSLENHLTTLFRQTPKQLKNPRSQSLDMFKLCFVSPLQRDTNEARVTKYGDPWYFKFNIRVDDQTLQPSDLETFIKHVEDDEDGNPRTVAYLCPWEDLKRTSKSIDVARFGYFFYSAQDKTFLTPEARTCIISAPAIVGSGLSQVQDEQYGEIVLNRQAKAEEKEEECVSSSKRSLEATAEGEDGDDIPPMSNNKKQRLGNETPVDYDTDYM